MMKSGSYPFHSILFSIYPVIYLYTNNIEFLQPKEPLRSLIWSVGITVFFLIAFRLILKRWDRAGLLISIIIFLFFSYGHIQNALPSSWFSNYEAPVLQKSLPWFWLFLFLGTTFTGLRVKNLKNITMLLNVFSFALVIFPIVTILSSALSEKFANSHQEQEQFSQLRGEHEAEASLQPLTSLAKPDIYYIVLDSYERADKLRAYYGFENASFLEKLSQRGFYIAEDSRSNYLNTTYSLNTAFNLVYFHEFPRNIMRNARYNLKTNYVTSFLRKQGYQIVIFDSGTGDSSNQYADIFERPGSPTTAKKETINRFEGLLLRTTAGLMLFGNGGQIRSNSRTKIAAATVDRALDANRERISYALNHIPDYAKETGPSFVFAHIYLPHMPFLYGPEGEPLKYHGNSNLYWYETEPENYIPQYIDQIKYLNQAIERMIDQIINNSKRPVVIILQSDHGDDYFYDWESPSAQGIDVRSATLNAIYYSDQVYEGFYSSVSTVNTFRLVFNHWFGTQYPVLSDRVFFHGHPTTSSPNALPDFYDSCEAFRLCFSEPTGLNVSHAP